MANEIKIRLLKLGKTQVDLLPEIHKRGYPNVYKTQLSCYVNERENGPQARAVRNIVDEILSDWEKKGA